MNNFFFNQLVQNFKIDQYLPAPHRFYSSAGSIFVAAAIGGAYGLLGRVTYPDNKISPLHYALWFSAAYQIKQLFFLVENHLHAFMNMGIYLEDLEQVPEDELNLENQIRYHIWKIIHIKTVFIKAIDAVFSKIFHIRPYDEINKENVDEASFIEMSRYRIGEVCKNTLIDGVSFSLAYRLVTMIGFNLPAHTAVPLFIIIRSIFINTIVIPAIHISGRILNKVADKLDEENIQVSTYRFHLINNVLVRWFPL